MMEALNIPCYPYFLSLTKDKDQGSDQMPVAISNEEAFQKLGGKEKLKGCEKRSEELQKKLINHTVLDDAIKEILPPTITWKSNSKKLVHQPYVKNLDELYAKAKKAERPFKDCVEKLAIETNSKPIVATLKSKERCESKANFKYKDQNGDIGYYRITDILRATLEFSDLDAMYDGAEKIVYSLGNKIKELNDRYQNPLNGGYRDIQMTFELDGFVCELQLSTEVMLRAKDTMGHRDYQVYRELLAAVEEGSLEGVKAALEFGNKNAGSNVKNEEIGQHENIKDLPHRAAESGHAKILEYYLKNEKFWQHKNIKVLPHRAAESGHAEILEYLIESGADPNATDEDGNTPLHHAVYNGYERCVWLLINKFKCDTQIKNKDNECPLLKGYFMLYGGQQPESQRRAMVTLIQATDIEKVKKTIIEKDKILKERVSNSRLLVDNAADGSIHRMKEQLRQFSDPNSSRNGETALQAAVRGGHIEAVELLLKFEASTDTKDDEKLIVQEAFDKDRHDIAKILIAKGAKCENVIWDELVYYVEENNIEKIKELLELGIDPNSSKDGVSALQAAVRKGNTDAVQLLLKHKASIEDRVGLKPILQEAIDLEHHNLKEILLDHGASCRKIGPQYDIIPCNLHSSNKWNWNGIANYKGKLFCTPHDAQSVLVIDEEGTATKTRSIQCNTSGGSKWSGMALCGTKLYCAPFSANSVLVIDGEEESVSFISCGEGGEEELKWFGIAAYDEKLFCAPYNASTILVVDTITEKIRHIPCHVPGKMKWCGIVRHGNYLYCAPYNASSVLVIDAELEKVHKWISCSDVSNEVNNEKWSGIARYENKLYCAPNNASSVLVINTDTQSIYGIPCNDDGEKKWRDITRFGEMLVCVPSRASSVLMIDGTTDEIITRPCNYDNIDQAKWSGIAQYGTKLYCSPALYKKVLFIEDQSIQLTIDQSKSIKAKTMSSSFLVDVVRFGSEDYLRKCLDSNFCPNSSKDGLSALEAAIGMGRQEAVERLLSSGASHNDCGQCLVTYALKCGHEDIVQTLSRYGASYNNLVEYASKGNIEKMEELLKDLKINPDSRSKDGLTALQAAVRGGHQDAMELLIQYNASLADRGDGLPIMQEALDFNDNIDIAQYLFKKGASCKNVGLSPHTIPLPKEDYDGNDWQWGGIAAYKNKLFCAPHHSKFLLVIDADTEEIRTIKLELEGKRKWNGIACCGNKLFCAPYFASSILVIDGDSEKVHYIKLDIVGEKKWHGIAAFGDKLFCTPYNARDILVIDAKTEKTRFIPCGMEGEWKWVGITKCGTKLFCSPYTASEVLVIDGESEKAHTIHFEKTTDHGNFVGIISYNDSKVYCAPWGASAVLVIDGETEETENIPISIDKTMKWHGVTQFDNKLYFAPCEATSILILDGETHEFTIQEYKEHNEEYAKWGSIARCGDKIFCAPFLAQDILILEDKRYKLDGFTLEEN